MTGSNANSTISGGRSTRRELLRERLAILARSALADCQLVTRCDVLEAAGIALHPALAAMRAVSASALAADMPRIRRLARRWRAMQADEHWRAA